MLKFLGVLLGIAAAVLAFIAFGQKEVGQAVLWGIPAVLLLIGSAGLMGQAKSAAGPGQLEDLVTKEHSRQSAVALSTRGGMIGIGAKQWLRAYEADPTIPAFGRPYWTPTGLDGAPELLSTIGLRGVEQRLEYVSQVSPDDALLPIMANDPHQRVREAARAKLRA